MSCAPISMVVPAQCWKHAEPTRRRPFPAWKNCSSNFATGKRIRTRPSVLCALTSECRICATEMLTRRPELGRALFSLAQGPRHQNSSVRTVTVKVIGEPCVDHYSAIIMRRRGMHEVEGAVGGTHFFFQAEDGIRDLTVTGVQTCALPI